jgi:hypothetical protein
MIGRLLSKQKKASGNKSNAETVIQTDAEQHSYTVARSAEDAGVAD